MSDVTTAAAAVEVPRVRASPWRLALRRFTRHRLAVAGCVVLVLVVLAAAFAGVLSGHSPTDVDLASTRQPPSGEHLLGTDRLGRDLLARILAGARISFLVAFVSALLSITIGMIIGTVSGFAGPRVDGVLRPAGGPARRGGLAERVARGRALVSSCGARADREPQDAGERHKREQLLDRDAGDVGDDQAAASLSVS